MENQALGLHMILIFYWKSAMATVGYHCMNNKVFCFFERIFLSPAINDTCSDQWESGLSERNPQREMNKAINVIF